MFCQSSGGVGVCISERSERFWERYFNKYWTTTDFDLVKIVISNLADYLSVLKKKVRQGIPQLTYSDTHLL